MTNALLGILVVAMIAIPAIIKLKQKPGPTRLARHLWAESVRNRGLSTEEALKEARVMGWGWS